MSLVTKNRAEEILEKAKNKRIAVIGDVILDCYLWGKVTRISPEAPVPIVQVQSKSFTLGGAANVMQNITALEGQVRAYSVSGSDDDRWRLLSLMKDKNIDGSCVEAVKDRMTIVKKRIMAGNQHLARIDYEDKHPIKQDVIKKIITSLEDCISSGMVEGVIFEDYAKGVLDDLSIARIIALCNKMGILTALDPHPTKTYANVSGVSFMTPNIKEFCTLYGDSSGDLDADDIFDANGKINTSFILKAQQVVKYYCKERLLVTLGAGGMVLFGNEDVEPTHIPTRAKEVFDVTGAGDTVIATMMLSLLGGATWEEAADLSNFAAGVVVGKVGTATVSCNELLKAVEMNGHGQEK